MMTYYTIDDLRLPPKRPFHRGWTMERFPTLAEALAWYRALPADCVKSLGMTGGVHVLELVRCLPLFPGDSEGENVLASCPQGGRAGVHPGIRDLRFGAEPSLPAGRDHDYAHPLSPRTAQGAAGQVPVAE